jgi:hypothetical protein
MDRLLNPNLAGRAEHETQLSGCFKVYLGAPYMDKGIDLVTDFVTKLIRPIIEAKKSLKPVNTRAKRDLRVAMAVVRNYD